MASFSSRRRDKESIELEEMARQLGECRARVEEVDSENQVLRKENRELKAAISRLEIRLQELKPVGRFIEGHGVLWHQSADGAVEPYAYCPTCRLVMTPFPSGYPETIICTQCKLKADFHPEDVPSLVEVMRG